ncbi:MAG TPA: MFS transporter [Ktedonobacteraceae bacterium]|nr:MFS transporter [Ktedonobacteraceae bacterium]
MSQVHNSSDVDTGDVSAHPHAPGEAGRAPRFSPLWRNRDYMLLWNGQLISSIGGQISLLAFPLLVLAITHSPAQAGIVGALRSLPFVLLSLPAGALVDRWDRKLVMLLCDTGRGLALASIPIALWFGSLSLLQLWLVALIEGTLMTFFSLAEAACLPHIVAKEQLPAATAQNQTIDSVAWTVGPFLGGLLYNLGTSIPFLTDAISYICSVLGIFLIRTRFQEERAEAPRHIWREIGEGLRFIWRDALLRFLALLVWGLVAPTIGFTLILIVLAQRLNASPVAIGILFASGGVGSVIGALITDPLQKRFTFGQMTIGAAWVWTISWLGLAIAPNLWLLGIANGLNFIIVPIYFSVQFSYRLLVVPDQLMGRVQSVFRLLSFGSQPLGLALTGALIQWIGPVWTVVALFVPQFLFALLATLYRPLRDAPSLAEVARPRETA